MEDNIALIFKCSNCGNSTFEEIKVNTILTGKVAYLDKYGEIEYESLYDTGGFISRFQCEECEYPITDKNGHTITDRYELYEFLSLQESNK